MQYGVFMKISMPRSGRNAQSTPQRSTRRSVTVESTKTPSSSRPQRSCKRLASDLSEKSLNKHTLDQIAALKSATRTPRSTTSRNKVEEKSLIPKTEETPSRITRQSVSSRNVSTPSLRKAAILNSATHKVQSQSAERRHSLKLRIRRSALRNCVQSTADQSVRSLRNCKLDKGENKSPKRGKTVTICNSDVEFDSKAKRSSKRFANNTLEIGGCDTSMDNENVRLGEQEKVIPKKRIRKSLLVRNGYQGELVDTRSSRTPNNVKRKGATIEDDDDQEDEEECQSLESASGPLSERENEYASLYEWITDSLENQKSLSIYISGCPGTGKTATVKRVLADLRDKVDGTIVNCVSKTTQRELITSILQELGMEMDKIDNKKTIANFNRIAKTLKRPFVLVLDEIDHLASNTNSALYSAFHWPHNITHNIVLIGIANSIDLTERLLPKLKLAQPPERLIFAPYTKDNISKILESKITEDGVEMDKKAVQFCAGKVAAMSGDLRTALHVVKTASKAMIVEAAAAAATPKDPATPIQVSTAPKGFREVMRVINNVYSSPIVGASLPLQPKILLTVCLTMSSNKKNVITRNALFNGYAKACKAVNVPSLDTDDLQAALQTLESQSFISVASNGQIRLQVDSTVAKATIASNGMIEQISSLHL